MPPQAYVASLGYFGFGLQTFLGTAVAPTVFPRWQSPGFEPNAKTQPIAEGDGSRVTSTLIKNQQMWAGPITIFPRPVELGWFLSRFAGPAQDAITGASDPYTHTITCNTGAASVAGGPYMTVERGFAGTQLIDRVQDCVIDQVEISGEEGKPLAFTMHLLGIKSVAQASAATVTLESGNVFPLHYHGVYALGGVSTGIAAQIKKFKFTLQNHHAVVQTESFTPDLLLPTDLDARGEFEAVFYDNAHYRKVYKNTGTDDSYLVGSDALNFTFTMQASPARSFSIQIGKAEYVASQPKPSLGTEELRQQVIWQATRPSTLTDFLKFVVLNGQSAAY